MSAARVVLCGGGHAHLAVLRDWSRNPIAGVETTLITPHRHMAYSGMLPGWIEGVYEQDEFLIDLAQLSESAGARLLLDEIVGLDARQKRILLKSGASLEHDVLSIATGGSLDLSMFAVIRDRLMPVRPIESFMQAWEELRAQAADHRSIDLAVVGGGAAGAELALAMSAALQMHPQARISLVAGRPGLLNDLAPAVRRRVYAALSDRGVVVVENDSVADEQGLLLSDGRRLTADRVIVATGSKPPTWIEHSGLALGPGRGVAVGPDMRSVSHAAVFAAGDVSERVDRTLAKSGVHAVRVGPVLAANIRAAIAGKKMARYQPRQRKLYLISTGGGDAVLSWGRMATQGRWVWQLKDWIDRRFVTRFQRAANARAPRDPQTLLPRLMASGSIVRTAVKVSLVVGTCLVAINQGEELLNGEKLSWGQIALNFLVPFLVASYSGARARRPARDEQL